MRISPLRFASDELRLSHGEQAAANCCQRADLAKKESALCRFRTLRSGSRSTAAPSTSTKARCDAQMSDDSVAKKFTRECSHAAKSACAPL